MARVRSNNSKWGSRPSRKKRPNRNKKPSKIRKNNSKLRKSKNPSRQIRNKDILKQQTSIPLISCEEELSELMTGERTVHNFLSERSNIFIKYTVTIEY